MIKKLLQSLWFKITKKSAVEDLGFSCCFCNQSITSADPDPSDMVIVANVDKPKEEQIEQIFWCHVVCLKSKIHPNIKDLFVLDDVVKQKK